MIKFTTDLKKRIIPIILVKDYQVVKSRRFDDYRVFGNLEQTITVFNNRNVDEIVILDIEASKKKLGVNIEILKILSKNNIMPLSYGGGISSIQDIELCLKHGCDKVVINSKSLVDINFIKEASNVFGSQCIVCSVDYKFNGTDFDVYSHSKIDTKKISLRNFIIELVSNGAGELILTSVDHEGMMNGYDKNFNKILTNFLKVPTILNGGCGKPEHILNAFQNNHIDAVCASSIFFYSQFSYLDIKDFLFKKKLNVRRN